MANHGWLSTKKFMTHEGLTEDLNELNKTLFRGIFEVCPYSNPEPPEDIIPHENRPKVRPEQGFEIFYHDDVVCLFWMNSQRRLEFRHQHGGSWVWWVELQIMCFLGRKYDGWVTDEGVDGRWRPKADVQYPDVKAWLGAFLTHMPPVARRLLVELESRAIPKEIRDLSTDGKPHGQIAELPRSPSRRGIRSHRHRTDRPVR